MPDRAIPSPIRTRMVRLVLTLFPVALGTPALGHDPKPVPASVEHTPTALPDRIILTFHGDPAHSQAVTWRTDTTVEKALAQIAEAEDGPLFVPKAISVPAETTKFTSNLGDAHFHSARFEGLKPSTQYVYRVGDGVNWSEWIVFRTASEKAEPFSFIYFGDAQNDLKQHWSRVIRGAYSYAPSARFIIHAGDLINRADEDAEWGEWFRAGGWVNAMVPSLPTPGNHEYARTTEGNRRVSLHWRPQFTLPENGVPGLEETCYHVDYQGVRVVSLNSNERQEEQVAWLEKVLGDNPNRWTVLTFHHPIYSSARGRDNAKLRDLWQPVFDKYKVDIVLQGHDHTYARSGLVTYQENVATGASFRNQDTGTLYVVSVSGPKMYNLDREPWMRRAAEDTQLYQILTIDGDTLRYEARTALGRLYDAFDLVKQDGQPNKLVDKAPSTEERLRSLREGVPAEPKKAAAQAETVQPRVEAAGSPR